MKTPSQLFSEKEVFCQHLSWALTPPCLLSASWRRQWEENKQSQHRSRLIQTDMEWIPRAGSLTTWKINVSILSFTWWKSKHVKKCFPNSTPRPCKYEQVPEAERTGNWILFQMRLVHTSINLWPGLVSKETTTKQQLTLQCSRST